MGRLIYHKLINEEVYIVYIIPRFEETLHGQQHVGICVAVKGPLAEDINMGVGTR